ncbi:alpha/beta hydrolase [Amycolatopsis sp. OK19-0408]|uniref:Alpha/beta hydrolase n=1 Tax=Amycolatopsis iheyensis TaxID=2945988 RepID=A0A9X2NIH8_9PSEU|nr:alpha/beta hydrolase [Amycolatopsis iheyensis]MCR6488473.1 alpha/beta hydrolase [Amycolatopsis iheyensis]
MRVLALIATILTTVGLSTGVAAGTTSGHHTGQLPDGASWVADVPAAWNGTTILYSHGFGPLTAQNAPDDETRTALLGQGYALVGSSYSGPSWWALDSAVRDQFDALAALERLTGHPRRTIAWGTSMGGLVSALEAEDGRLDGVLSTCGLVAGALNLNNYQLDGEYALAHLLAPGQPVKLVRFASPAEGAASAAALTKIATDAQGSPAGRARIALAAALLNEPGWFTGPTPPPDYAGQEVQQQQELTQLVLGFVVAGRYQVELAAGGNSAFTAGVDYRTLLGGSGHARQVRALYRAAGLDLDADLAKLTRDADIRPDPRAVRTLARTSMVTGRLRVPTLNIHTTADQLVPVEQEDWYAGQVRRAGRGSLLRQAYVGATGHCAFRTSETIAALHALESRIETGRWSDGTEPRRLNEAAGDGRYVRFEPARLTGGLGEPGR